MDAQKITVDGLTQYGFEFVPDDYKEGVEVAYLPDIDVRMLYNSQDSQHEYWTVFYNGEWLRIQYIDELKKLFREEVIS